LFDEAFTVKIFILKAYTTPLAGRELLKYFSSKDCVWFLSLESYE